MACEGFLFLYSKAFVGARERLDFGCLFDFPRISLGSDEIFLSQPRSASVVVVATQEAPIPTLCRLSVSRTEQSRNGPQDEELRGGTGSFPQSSEDHSEGEGEEETGALGLWTPASRIGATSTGTFVASVVPCEHAANVCVLSGSDRGLCEAPIRHHQPQYSS